LSLINLKKLETKYVDGTKVGHREKLIARTLYSFCLSHPCQGARLAIARDGVYLSVVENMNSVESAFDFLTDLQEYYSISDELKASEKSLAIAFYAEPVSSQEDFAARYWSFTQTLHDLDCQRNVWDPTVSSNWQEPDFELSLGGRAVFTTTLNPQNPRFARKFSYPVWIMNQLSQFNYLRQQGLFTKWQNRIRELDSKFDPSGQPNPILADHGDETSAHQLAGSKLDDMEFTIRKTEQDRNLAKEAILSRAVSEGCPPDIILAISQWSLGK
jgi:FPC/CPF motif-containing protein YcgG